MNVYDFNVKKRDGNEESLSIYQGKVLLIVNSATECGFTPQYDELEEMYKNYQKKGLEILDFPCNQFGGQAPGSDEEIHSFCTLKFGVAFPQYSKIDVNGENEILLYRWLKDNTKFEGIDQQHPIGAILHDMLLKQDSEYEKNSDIKWNFTKFLINRDGDVVARFEPTTDLKVIQKKVEELL